MGISLIDLVLDLTLKKKSTGFRSGERGSHSMLPRIPNQRLVWLDEDTLLLSAHQVEVLHFV